MQAKLLVGSTLDLDLLSCYLFLAVQSLLLMMRMHGAVANTGHAPDAQESLLW